MATVGNITILDDLRDLLVQYLKNFVVTNIAGAPMFEVLYLHPFEYSESAKAPILLYDLRTDNSNAATNCSYDTPCYWSIAIKRRERNDTDFDKQRAWTASLFDAKSWFLNSFGGSFQGVPFTSMTLGDFGLSNFRTTAGNQSHSQNDIYYTFGVSADVRFKNQIHA